MSNVIRSAIALGVATVTFAGTHVFLLGVLTTAFQVEGERRWSDILNYGDVFYPVWKTHAVWVVVSVAIASWAASKMRWPRPVAEVLAMMLCGGLFGIWLHGDGDWNLIGWTKFLAPTILGAAVATLSHWAVVGSNTSGR